MPELRCADDRAAGEKESAAIIGFTSAIAAYGAFFIPKSFGTSIAHDRRRRRRRSTLPRFYVSCAAITWFVYTRRAACCMTSNGSGALHPARSRAAKGDPHHEPFSRPPDLLPQKSEPFSDGHGITTDRGRDWEDGYRKRWQHDKIVRSTHGVNCTGSCSWKIYVKGGIVTWETQQTDYPRTRPDLPNHEPRGCPRGASYSWYLYSGNRVKYPLIRKRGCCGCGARRGPRCRRSRPGPRSSENPAKRASYTAIAAMAASCAPAGTRSTRSSPRPTPIPPRSTGPDRVIGFSPIPAMSMVSYAAGSRYLSLLGGVCMSFYDWYCDLPPAARRPGASRPTCRKRRLVQCAGS
jgi:hypothetical protein